MSQLTIVYIIITAVVAITLYRIIAGIYNTFKSKSPSKCTNCYLKETCKTRINRGHSCSNYQNRHIHHGQAYKRQGNNRQTLKPNHKQRRRNSSKFRKNINTFSSEK